ncbi:hypothetical protein CUV01_14420 [Paracoccus tegillarcae]|uniref:Plasmid recombination enzyme n=2 Tax=Paracoccus tegillarcae TaxID=1529068 RepID=A0A2K9F229_9RHOB|nr:hypothetical protein CUV01_14420 [Paracoccus tegillarcae]
MAGLTRAEKHGKREDWIGRQRQVRDQKPLYVGGLDLVALYIEHTDGARQNKGAKKPVLHFIVRFPPEVLTDEGPTPYAKRDRAGREKLMVRQAVKFINENHGGQAVFSARLDRDEVGETIVDVFACPRYMKPSRSGRREPTLWTSATKFGEELARKHQDHIKTRMTGAETVKPITSPRAVGMALQQEFAEFFERENGMKLAPRNLKDSRAKDRLEVEEWRLKQIQAEARMVEEKRDKKLAEAWSEVERARKEVRALRRQLLNLIDQARTLLNRPDLSKPARMAGNTLMNLARPFASKKKESGVRSMIERMVNEPHHVRPLPEVARPEADGPSL